MTVTWHILGHAIATLLTVAAWVGGRRALRAVRGRRTWIVAGVVLPDPEDPRWNFTTSRAILGSISVSYYPEEVFVGCVRVGHSGSLARRLQAVCRRRELEHAAAEAQRAIEGDQ